MNPDRLGELLSAYLDGELSERERQAVARLLEQSPAARLQLQQLQEGASALRPLRPQRPHRDLAAPVLQAIAERRLRSTRRLVFAETAVPTWFGAGVAAAVVLLISVATLVYFAVPAKREARYGPPLAKRPARAGKPRPVPAPTDQESADDVRTTPEPPSPARAKDPAPAVVRPPTKSPAHHAEHELASPPAPEAKVENFGNKGRSVTLKLPLRLAGRHPAEQLLREKLKQARALRVELLCLGRGKALARVQARLRALGVQLLIDPAASNHLHPGAAKTSFVIYSESLTAHELGNLLAQLGAEEDRASQKNEAQFGDLLVSQYSDEDRVQLSALLGVDPAVLPSPHGAPLGVDVRQPLEDSTASNLANVLSGKGTPHPGHSPDGAKSTPTAIMLLAHPARAPAAQSKEVRRFLKSRKAPRPAGVPVLLILRGVNG